MLFKAFCMEGRSNNMIQDDQKNKLKNINNLYFYFANTDTNNKIESLQERINSNKQLIQKDEQEIDQIKKTLESFRDTIQDDQKNKLKNINNLYFYFYSTTANNNIKFLQERINLCKQLIKKDEQEIDQIKKTLESFRD